MSMSKSNQVWSQHQPVDMGIYDNCTISEGGSVRHLLGANESGWVISGEIHEDYFEWLNEFEAEHPDHGRVWGNFEETVYATSKEAYEAFIESHPPELWDSDDI